MGKNMTVVVKIIDNKGYIARGAIGVGFGAWSRAARIRNALQLTELPVSVPPEEWQKLTAERLEEVRLSS